MTATTKRRSVGALMVAAIVAGTVVLGACGVPLDRGDRPLTTDQFDGIVPASTQPAGRVLPAAALSIPFDVYWIEGKGVRASRRALGSADLPSALDALRTGPTPAEANDGLASSVSDPTMLLDASISAGTVTVTVSQGFVELPPSEQALAAAQVVFTLTGVPGAGLVSFVAGDRTVSVARTDGTRADGPVSRDDYASVLTAG